MKASKEDNFSKLLKHVGSDQPAGDFTAAVMNIIEADAAHEIALHSLLKQHPAEGPAFNFTTGVMAQISTKPRAMVFQPIISKKAWYGISVFFGTILMVLIGLSNSEVANSHRADNAGTVITRYVAAMPGIYVMAAALIALLFLADYLITSRTGKTTAN